MKILIVNVTPSNPIPRLHNGAIYKYNTTGALVRLRSHSGHFAAVTDAVDNAAIVSRTTLSIANAEEVERFLRARRIVKLCAQLAAILG